MHLNSGAPRFGSWEESKCRPWDGGEGGIFLRVGSTLELPQGRLQTSSRFVIKVRFP